MDDGAARAVRPVMLMAPFMWACIVGPASISALVLIAPGRAVCAHPRPEVPVPCQALRRVVPVLVLRPAACLFSGGCRAHEAVDPRA